MEALGKGEPVVDAMRPLLDQPQAALAELRAFASKDHGPGNEFVVPFLTPHWFAYFGDPEGALQIMRSGSFFRHEWKLRAAWRPVMKDVRKLPGFKQLMRDLGAVDQWREFGWPDLCKPVGATDFECS